MKTLLYILICILLIAMGQVLLKFGINRTLENTPLESTESALQLVWNPYILSGIVIYFLVFLLWMYILSNSPVSYAYPFISLSYPLVVILSDFILKEPINNLAWVGIVLIFLGTAILGMYASI